MFFALQVALFCTVYLPQQITPAPATKSARPDEAPVAPSPVSPAKRLEYERHALTHQGDVLRGLRLFQNEKLTRCLICHKNSFQGGEVGPDLSNIGGKFDRPHLIESLLEPSRQIVEGFRTTVLTTKDGRVQTGILRIESRTAVTLVDANGKKQSIETKDIDTKVESPVSLMPEGLADALTKEQFTDLIAYLESLRPGGKPTPGGGINGAIQLPAGFEIKTIATGLNGCTAIETLPDGRILVCEQLGNLRIIKDGKLLDKPLLTVSVDSTWERGLLGVTVHPDFPITPYVYVCYVARSPYPHHRVSRFSVEGDTALPESESILFSGDDQRTLGGKVPAGHQGGAIHFGPGGKLYVAIGEQTAEQPAQRLDTLQGKLCRLNPDGSIPADNPFVRQTSGKYQAIWALGLRNPFTFAVQPVTGEMLINDVGGKFEEINRGRAGANYGWPTVEHGPTADARFVGPIYWYPEASIVGGDFASENSPWPSEYRGRYFFADFVQGWIKTFDLQKPSDVGTFATALRRPVGLRFAPNGDLYVLLRNAWVVDAKFQPNTGALLQIHYAGPFP